MSLFLILADISPIFTFCSGQFIVSFIYLSKMLYSMLSIGVKVKVKAIDMPLHVETCKQTNFLNCENALQLQHLDKVTPSV